MIDVSMCIIVERILADGIVTEVRGWNVDVAVWLMSRCVKQSIRMLLNNRYLC